MKKILKTITTLASSATATATIIALIDNKIQAKLKSGSENKKVGSITSDDIIFIYKGKNINPDDYVLDNISYDLINTKNDKKIARVKFLLKTKLNDKDYKSNFEFTGFKTAEDDLFSDEVKTKGNSSLTAAEFVRNMQQKATYDELLNNLNNSNEYNYEFSDFSV
ncbi:hypothetical protein KQ873_01985, partial [Mycoplasma zalophidermidis]